MMVAVLNEAGAFPTDYWSSGRAPHRETLQAENYPTWARVENGTCPPCPVRCRRHLTILEGPHAGREIHGPEYETLYSFGGLCMVEQAQDVVMLHEECNRLGVDTMSAGNVVALAIKAGQRGTIDGAPAPGRRRGHRADAPGDRRSEHPAGRHLGPRHPRRRRGSGHGGRGHTREGPGAGRLRPPRSARHGPGLCHQPARRLPPARHVLQTHPGRHDQGSGRARERRDSSSTTRTACSSTTAWSCAASTATG